MNEQQTDELRQLLKDLSKEEADGLKGLLQMLLLVSETNDIVELNIKTAGTQLTTLMANVEVIQNFRDFLSESIDVLREDLR